MADYENQTLRGRPVSGTDSLVIDQGLRAYMVSVYQYMMIGLGVTGLVSYLTSATPALFNAIYGTPLVWVVMFAPLIFVMAFSFAINRVSVVGAQAMFWVFSALMGLSLAYIFRIYVAADIVRVFFITAASFGALSLYGYTTKRDLTAFGSFLFIGLVGVFLASIVNIFMQSSALNFAVSIVGVLVFAGLTAFDTQKIKEMYYEGDSADTAGKKAIMGALNLYLDFINMFLFLLRLLGNRE